MSEESAYGLPSTGRVHVIGAGPVGQPHYLFLFVIQIHPVQFPIAIPKSGRIDQIAPIG